ncbi:MAG TPA: hypothetical protein VFS31_01025 [Chitinophagaceae bacterium]|nr:hypothetical protein [Chitinophagaceae bacterium]
MVQNWTDNSCKLRANYPAFFCGILNPFFCRSQWWSGSLSFLAVHDFPYKEIRLVLLIGAVIVVGGMVAIYPAKTAGLDNSPPVSVA